MKDKTKSGINNLEQTTDAEGLAEEVKPKAESDVQAKQNYKLDNMHIEIKND
ncbi:MULTISPECIES: hypothetical protein [unclassified Paenibacillus]|uniref:hypothetical protein n=1 Tax=unclassified Paenibacillus TaxID=185978 RepID=UPI001AE44CB7|nr:MULTISPECIES: hypothetical protein [unclassified Paenibacillus]MBP1153727.1 hypothetical protein [Paenibacillus sp. PvP091]MBP1170888.1 hypothetical protein [Paenibacillus sp. PvR098]MBP2441916.1 hypothetical protein [Paenibacillus sp. PvP052]